MPVAEPRDSTIAVVGDGLGSLIVYATAVWLGFRPDQITIFGENDSPVRTYRQLAEKLGQSVVRSTSESHFLPADWPAFAHLDAWSRRNPALLLRPARPGLTSGVADLVAEATAVGARLRWNDSRYPSRIGWLERAGEVGANPHFVLYDEAGGYAGRTRHVMLALGHGSPTVAPALARARADAGVGKRIVQAHEAKRYDADGRYVVVGAGIAAVNEWANVLAAGAMCVSLTRNPEPDEQDLNTPGCVIRALGADAFKALGFDARLALLGRMLGRPWQRAIEAGRQEGRLEQVIGEIDLVERGPLGLRVHVRSRHAPDPGWLDVTGIVSASGLNGAALSLPLLRRLVELYKVPLEGERLRLNTRCGVPGLDRRGSRCAVMGAQAASVLAHADTIAGLKYVGRRFVADCYQAEGWAGTIERRGL
ncbi:MAG: hypothetical protein LC790_03150, partial [Actinobacteria bacterium]|nr:hypothetical protein [Actinomycetota bacterium]